MALKKINGLSINFEIEKPKIELLSRTKYFEKESFGKNYADIPEIVSRMDASICAAQTIASVMCIEEAFGVTVSKQTIILRDLLLKAEVIYSNTSYLHDKIIPRFAGKKDYFEIFEKLLKEKNKVKTFLARSRRILEILGGRYPHPITVAVGSHLKIITEEEKIELLELLKSLLPDALKTLDFIQKNSEQKIDIETNLTSLWQLDTLPYISEKIISGEKTPMTIGEYYDAYDISKNTLVGPISRISNNSKLLSFNAEKYLKKSGLKLPLTNPYQNTFCMALEVVHCIERSIESLSNSHFEKEEQIKSEIKHGIGKACVESAKGTVYHEYALDEKGIIIKARLILPIDQNSKSLQETAQKIPLDYHKKTGSQIIEEIEFLIDAYYI